MKITETSFKVGRSLLFLIFGLFLMGSLLAACGSGTKGGENPTPQGEGASQGETTGKPPEKVVVTLDWYPNTNHTGLYVAKEKGYYKEQGLDVEIIQPGESTADQLVASGKADFGVSYSEGVTLARATDLPIVSIAAVIQHNTSAFASLPEAGIKSPKDFEGKKYGGWGSPTEEAVIKALMEKYGADSTKWTNITLGQTDFFSSIGKQVDFEWIYYGWDGIEAERRGMKINTIFLRDLDPDL
ncbi:MAG: ABC transporter substrate-binding protein, partial [Thermicanus sp.]|nr:ABC transporter substrate-binding protein [Thermicanus sp.]